MKPTWPWICLVSLMLQVSSTCVAFHTLESSHRLNDTECDPYLLLLKTNLAEMRNVPIFFSKPLPSWLKGILVRNGPAMFEHGDRTFIHIFDGFAKLASWQFFGNGSAVFSTRFIKSNSYKDTIDSNTIAPFLFFDSVTPPFGFFEKLESLIRGLDNMNVNVYAFRNPKSKKKQYAALNDYWIMYKISIETLSTKSRIIPKINNKRRYIQSQTRLPIRSMGFTNFLSSAHPLPEFGTNNHLTFMSSMAVFPWESNEIYFVRMQSLKKRRIIARWSVDRLPYMHSFSVTQTRAVLLANPFFVDVMCVARKVEPFSCLDWYADEAAVLYVIDLKEQTMDTIKIPNTFTMHHINAYDDANGNIIMDISTYPNPDFIGHLLLDILRDPVKRNQFPAQARLKRVSINVKEKKATIEDIGLGPTGIAALLDMPVINEAYRSKHYCYVYGLVVKTDNITLNKVAIVKKDVCLDGRGDKAWHVPGQYPVEPWFEARPNAIEEDDGILFVPVFHGEDRASYLVLLDAQTFNVISEAKMPTIVPYSIHGRFFPL